MDTTLRDGEQTPDVSFSAREKLAIAKALLCQVRVDRIEIGSARVSAGEKSAARRIAAWAAGEGLLGRVEMLGFCDEGRSVSWILDAGVTRMNLLVKGSERHCRLQLGMDLGQHLAAVARTLEAAARGGLVIAGVYLEDWSRGISESPAHVMRLTAALSELGVQRVYLADTLGVLEPASVTRYVRRMCRRFPALSFEFHGHDDYGLATANALAAVRAGARGLHVTVNGMGERAGNACLSELCPVLSDHAGRRTSVDETQLWAVSELVARCSRSPVAPRAPLVGRHVFTQTAGIHADGDAKANLYASRLAPERFGRQRAYALGKLCGRASLEHHLRALGLELEPERLAALLALVVARGDQKRRVRREDLPLLLSGLDAGRGTAARARVSSGKTGSEEATNTAEGASAARRPNKTLMPSDAVGYARPLTGSSRAER
jgi:D-citramalate synthase